MLDLFLTKEQAILFKYNRARAMSRHIEKSGSHSSSQDDVMVPDTIGSKKTRDMLIGFPIFASKINTQLIGGILKDDKKYEAARDFSNVVVQNHSYNPNLDLTDVDSEN